MTRAELTAIGVFVREEVSRVAPGATSLTIPAPQVTTQINLAPVVEVLGRLADAVAQTNALLASFLDRPAPEMPAAVVNVPAPVVNVAAPTVNVEAPQVTVEVPAPAPQTARSFKIEHSDGTDSYVTEQ